MNNQQNCYFPFKDSMPPYQNKQLSESNILQEEILTLQEQFDQAIESNKELQYKNEELDTQVSILKQQLYQKDQESNTLRKILENQRIFSLDQSDLKNNLIEVQVTNQKLLKQLDQLKQNRQIFDIECKTNISQNIRQEMIRLSWYQTIDNLQLQYKWNNKIFEIKGYGEINNNLFTFFQKCELSNIPLKEQKPQIISKEYELFIIIQI